VEGQTVVVRDSGTAAEVGDVLKKIDGRPVSDLRAELRRYAAGSNEAARDWRVNQLLLRGPAKKACLRVQRGDEDLEIAIERVSMKERIDWGNAGRPAYRKLDGNVGYIDLEVLRADDIADAMAALRHTLYAEAPSRSGLGDAPDLPTCVIVTAAFAALMLLMSMRAIRRRNGERA